MLQRSGPIRFGLPLAAMLMAAQMGCTTMAEITTLSESTCRDGLGDHIRSILVEEGEHDQTAERLSAETVSILSAAALGPRPFTVLSPSGTDYGFFVQRKGSACLLRLYLRQKGFTRYTNTLTSIATRPLHECSCAE